MKKVVIVLLMVLLLSGCGQDHYEQRQAPCGTQTASPAPGVINISVTDELSAPVMSTREGDRIYIADDYEVSLQTLPGGAVDETLKICTGFDRDKLTVLETEKDGMKRYDCVWSSAGEGTQWVGRTTVLDDGAYHYVLTVTGDDGSKVASAWQQLSDSFSVSIVQ